MKNTKMKPPKPNLDNFEPSLCESVTRTAGSGGISIIMSKNGKRVSLSDSVLRLLADAETVQIAYADSMLAIGKHLGNQHTNYQLKANGKTKVIYNSQLVKEIVDRYRLDYSKRTSLTFPVLEAEESDGNVVVYITMNSTNSSISEPMLKESASEKGGELI